MAGTSFRMDISALQNAVQQTVQAMTNRQQLMEAIGEALVSSTLERFENGVGPDGASWQPTQRGGQILVDSGQLKGSIVYEASPDMVAVGSNKVYSAIHQLGGQCGRGHKVTMPARPYLGINAEDREEIAEMMRLHIMQGLGR
ncbi:phage virion morphogenesis protein [Desulfovibrio cuneatus]|uniref:phage virion morphogenesis protein n=1 Tax=Desulfovibrio cuneatus TaxID=159728 RepID=UPI00041193B8|nr:phage virion morphogenesis protein [Desulfovibrio cuneatus]